MEIYYGIWGDLPLSEVVYSSHRNLKFHSLLLKIVEMDVLALTKENQQVPSANFRQSRTGSTLLVFPIKFLRGNIWHLHVTRGSSRTNMTLIQLTGTNPSLAPINVTLHKTELVEVRLSLTLKDAWSLYKG